MPTINMNNTDFYIKDGTGTPNSLRIHVGTGNITWSEKRNMEYLLDRGQLYSVREGDEVPMDVSFEFTWEFLVSDSMEAISPEEALKKTGQCASWVTTGVACEPYAVDLELKNNVTCGSTLDELIHFDEFRYESLDHDLKAAMVSCKGKCNATEPVITRTTFA